ncbi:MAG: type VI secretion system tip protein VgrG [Sandaracinaceae bacterium]|nr:type VI secretion system tip protein VgrG [Sandaracinaceae bacterium]
MNAREPETVADRADLATFRFVGQHVGVDDFVVWGFEGTERLNHPYSFRIELIPTHEDVDPMGLLGFGATLTLERRAHQRAIQGVVERVTIEHRYDPPRAVAVLVPALVASRYTTATRIFQGSTALEIVERVLTEDLGRFRRAFDASGLDRERFARRDYCVQYRESNFDFVHRLLEEEGVGYYFCAGESSETLVLFESNRSLSSVETLEPGPLPFDLGTQKSGTAELIHWFSSERGLVTGATTVRDHDWIQGRSIVESSARSEPSAHELGEHYDHGLGRGVTVYEDAVQHGAATAAAIAAALPMGMPLEVKHSVIDLPGAVLPPWSGNDVDRQPRLRLDCQRRDRHTFQGGGSVCGFAVGSTFELMDRAGGHDIQYLLTRVTHRALPSKERSADDAIDSYENEFECLPSTTPWRPDRRTPKPRIHGVQTATVAGPVGADLYTDPHGRIKVVFHWDRASPDLSGNQTCWLRVGQVWAGQGAPAFSFVPRVGMEVIVTFVDGDPDRPLVIGCVNNATNPTPGLLPVQATKSVIRTRTVPHGPGYNEISFEDAEGVERVHIRAERDLDELVCNDHVTVVQRDRDLAVAGNYRSYVRRSASEDVGASLLSRARGDRTTITGGDSATRIGGDSTVEVSGDVYVKALEGSVSVELGRGLFLVYGEGPIKIMLGAERYIRITPDAESDGSIEVVNGDSSVTVDSDEIRMSVGRSRIVATDSHIQINNKIFPTE